METLLVTVTADEKYPDFSLKRFTTGDYGTVLELPKELVERCERVFAEYTELQHMIGKAYDDYYRARDGAK